MEARPERHPVLVSLKHNDDLGLAHSLLLSWRAPQPQVLEEGCAAEYKPSSLLPEHHYTLAHLPWLGEKDCGEGEVCAERYCLCLFL